MRRSVAALAAVLAVTIASEAVRAETACLRRPTRDWRDGPARYLLTEDEWARYGRLESDAAREGFVARFWKRLDSDGPATERSFRELFEERCLEAEARFRQEDPPGWRSDRGKVLLLLGDPKSIERLPGDAESVAREMWVYPYPAGGGASSLRIPFYLAVGGSFLLEPRRAATNIGTPVVYDVVRGRARAISRDTTRVRGSAAGAKIDAILSRPAVEPPPRPAAVAPPPGTSEDEDAAVSSKLRDGIWFFQAADGSVLALLAVVLVPGSGLDESSVRGSAFVVEGAVAGRGDGSAQIELTDARRGVQGRLVLVGRVLLEPGASARVRYAFTDATRRTMLVRSRTVDVPELGTGGFAVSSVVPAESFGPLPEGLESVFAVGSDAVVPRPEASFARGETLRLYLQVYGAEADRATGLPRVDVEFLFRREGTRWSSRHGRPFRLRSASGASLGLAIPIDDWPLGAYGVEVRLHDRVAGRVASAEGKFRVTE